MNCNVQILQTYDVPIKGDDVCRISRGENYDGTTQANGGVLFHVTTRFGKIQPVFVTMDDERVKIRMFDTKSV